MHVMMPEVSSAAAHDAAERLTAAGHQVHVCHNPDDHGFACVALRGSTCPLETQPVDVVVNVRRTTDAHPTPVEDGAICGARRHVPLVVAGEIEHNPFLPWTTTEIEGSDVVPAVAVAATMAMAAHSTIGTDVLRDAIRRRGGDPRGAHCEVRRSGGRLQVTLAAEPAMDKETARTAAVQVTQALRAYDPWAGGIDVIISAF